MYSLSHLETDALRSIQKKEKQLSLNLLAFSPHQANAAGLNDEQLKAIKDLEKELGVVLVALNQ